MVAALRAGASRIAVPSILRDPAVDRALRRMPALAAALHWLDPGAEVPADAAARWLLLPASALIHVSALEGLLATAPSRPVMLAESAGGTAPVALVPAPPAAALPPTLWKDLAGGRPVGPELARWLRETEATSCAATGPYVDVRDEVGLAPCGGGPAGHAVHPRRLRDGPVPAPPVLPLDHAAPGADGAHAQPCERREPGHRPGRDLVLLARHADERLRRASSSTRSPASSTTRTASWPGSPSRSPASGPSSTGPSTR